MQNWGSEGSGFPWRPIPGLQQASGAGQKMGKASVRLSRCPLFTVSIWTRIKLANSLILLADIDVHI